MTDWRDKLKSGSSFRGVPFNIISAEFTGGRRTVKHVYPQRDKTFSEDMGREGRGFPVEAFLVGDDYLDQAEDLIEALETAGPGELVHAYFGTHNVIAPRYTLRVTKDQGGYATISITFDQTDEEPAFPSAAIDPAATINLDADAAIAAVGVDLTALHDLTDLTVATVANIASVLSSAGAQLRTALGPIATTAAGLASLQTQLATLQSSAVALASAPADLLSLLGDVFLALEPPDPRAGVAALLAAYNFIPSGTRPLANTQKQRRAQTTYDATRETIQRYALIQAVRTAIAGSSSVAARSGAVSSYPSFEDALAARDLVAAALDEQLELASDTVYPVLMQLRADLVRMVPGNDTELAHLIAYTPIVSLPSLVVSHNLYGNLDGEADLIARNRIKHPGFVTGGIALEVLSRA